MKRKIIIILICIIVLIIGIVSLYIIINKNNQKNIDNSTTIYNSEGNIIYNQSKQDEITETIENTMIQGIVELNNNGYIYIFNGQHFGEFGFEMEEYTRANIEDKKQKCIDYITLEEYDTSYIEEGDVLICSGDLYKKGYGGINDFNTKDNPIVVLKSNDYTKMKKDALSENSKYSSVITIEESYTESGYVYLKYTLEDDTNSDTGYNFPFGVKAYITDNTKVEGELQNGKIVEVEYENIEGEIDELNLQSIKVIENK